MSWSTNCVYVSQKRYVPRTASFNTAYVLMRSQEYQIMHSTRITTNTVLYNERGISLRHWGAERSKCQRHRVWGTKGADGREKNGDWGRGVSQQQSRWSGECHKLPQWGPTTFWWILTSKESSGGKKCANFYELQKQDFTIPTRDGRNTLESRKILPKWECWHVC